MAGEKYITSLSIQKRDGTTIPIQGGKLALANGIFMNAEADAEDNSITLSSGADKGFVDQEMLDKFNALIYGGSGTANGVPYHFVGPTGHGAPYYFSQLDGATPLDGHAFLTAKMSTHIGLFEDRTHPSRTEQGLLEITDVNRPCVDCAEYSDLYKYVDAVRDALTDKKDALYKEVVQAPGDDEQRNMLALDKQLFLYWNNMVQRTAWRCNAMADGAEINAALMFTNHFNSPLAAGTFFKMAIVSVAFYLPDGEDDTSLDALPPNGKLIDYSVPSGWIKDVDYELIEEPEHPGSINEGNWRADVLSKTVFIDTPSPSGGMPAEGGFVFVFKIDPDGGSFVTGGYEVLSVLSSQTFVINVPELGAGGNDSGTLRWMHIITIGINLLNTLPVGESIRLYMGAYSWGYRGGDGNADVFFKNNIEDKFAGYPSTKKITTNNMVVITPIG